MTAPWLEVTDLDVDTLEGRPLLRGLRLSLGDDQVAVIGRNGVGKSTLLGLLAGQPPHPQVRRRGRVGLVRQEVEGDDVVLRRAREAVERRGAAAWGRVAAGLGALPDLAAGAGLSPGQRRKLALVTALVEEPDLLLLDEPGEDLDARGLDWLRARLRGWRRGLVVVSHEPALLDLFEHFFVMSESGCRHLQGRHAEVVARLADEQARRERRYQGSLSTLAGQEQHDLQVRRRRARKKALGRLHELKRCTPRSRLNGKRGAAQVSQARVAGIREARIGAVRTWARATRRALAVRLPLRLLLPPLPPDSGQALVELHDVELSRGGRRLFQGLSLRLGRERLALVGPNGAGKTSLIALIGGGLRPDQGRVRVRQEHLGLIDQGAMGWCVDDSLLQRLTARGVAPEALAGLIVAHGLPLSLAERPLRTLSPGERVRAALVEWMQQPGLELLVLDEPTWGLDDTGRQALVEALQAWEGGLVLATHDEDLLRRLEVERVVRLG